MTKITPINHRQPFQLCQNPHPLRRFFRSCAWSCSFLLASCGIYNSHFDCPAGEGVGCRPVNEILAMIVESEEQEDLFESDEERREEWKALNKKREKALRSSHRPKKLYLEKEVSGVPVLTQGEG